MNQRSTGRTLSRLLWACAALATIGAAVAVARFAPESGQVVSTGSSATAAFAAQGTEERSIQDVIAEAEDVYQAMGAPPRRGPLGEPTSALSNQRGASAVARVDAEGKRAYLSPAEVAMMRSNASAALTRLFTPTLATSMLAVVDRAISMQSGGNFVVGGGGANLKSFDSLAINGDKAQVRATVTHWSLVGQLQPDGSVRWARPENDLVVDLKLVRQGPHQWLISDRNWDFAPGQSP